MTSITNTPPPGGPPGPGEPVPNIPANRVAELAKKVFEFVKLALYHTGLMLVKLVVIPILLVSTGIVAIAYCVGHVFDLVVRLIDKNGTFAVVPHLSSLVNELVRVMKIAAKFGFGREGEELQKADNDPKSPHFVHICPKNETTGLAPLLVAPGYLDEAETMRDMCRNIANKSGRHVYIVTYYNRFETIPQLGADIARVAKHVIQERGDSRLILGGHSMGGLTTGSYLKTKPDINVTGWWTIGTPLNGTPMAHLGVLGKCGEQMQPNSPFMKEFHRDLSALEPIPQLHVYSETDHVVPPRGLLPFGEHFRCEKDLGHLGVRESNHVLDKIVETMNCWEKK